MLSGEEDNAVFHTKDITAAMKRYINIMWQLLIFVSVVSNIFDTDQCLIIVKYDKVLHSLTSCLFCLVKWH